MTMLDELLHLKVVPREQGGDEPGALPPGAGRSDAADPGGAKIAGGTSNTGVRSTSWVCTAPCSAGWCGCATWNTCARTS